MSESLAKVDYITDADEVTALQSQLSFTIYINRNSFERGSVRQNHTYLAADGAREGAIGRSQIFSLIPPRKELLKL